jgi:hypothetical protein
MFILLDAIVTLSWLNLAAGLLPLLAAIVGSYMALSTRITRMEVEVSAYKKEVDKLEVQSEKHYTELFREIDAVVKSIQSLEKAVLETSIRRQNEYENVKDFMRNMTTSMQAQEIRIKALETSGYENRIDSHRSTRRKGEQD